MMPGSAHGDAGLFAAAIRLCIITRRAACQENAVRRALGLRRREIARPGYALNIIGEASGPDAACRRTFRRVSALHHRDAAVGCIDAAQSTAGEACQTRSALRYHGNRRIIDLVMLMIRRPAHTSARAC